MSARGFAAFLCAAAGLPLGTHLLLRSIRPYPGPPDRTLLLAGLVALAVFGIGLFEILRRREYPWIIAFAAVALPLFEPAMAPYHLLDRVVVGVRDVVLVGAAVILLLRGVTHADELERRTHIEALVWSYAVVAVALVCSAFVEDILPPLRGTWIASAMLATWFIAWIVSSIRYQR
jgi:hypothetical protein